VAHLARLLAAGRTAAQQLGGAAAGALTGGAAATRGTLRGAARAMADLASLNPRGEAPARCRRRRLAGQRDGAPSCGRVSVSAASHAPAVPGARPAAAAAAAPLTRPAPAAPAPADAVICAAVRTPVGAFQGALSGLSAPQLGGRAIRGARRRGVAPTAPRASPGHVPPAACARLLLRMRGPARPVRPSARHAHTSTSTA
jgi:hypothetical protein